MTTKAQRAPAEQREYLLSLFDRMTSDQREEYLWEARQMLGLPAFTTVPPPAEQSAA
jgi:hypothetical protein